MKLKIKKLPLRGLLYAPILAGSILPALAAQTLPIQNYSFESQAIAVGTYSSGLGSLTGWTINGGNGKISLVSPTSTGSSNNGLILRSEAVASVSGSTLLGLTNNGTVGKSVSQTLTGFAPGQDYTFGGYFGSQYGQAAQFIGTDSLVISLSDTNGIVMSNTIAISAIPGVTAIPSSDRSNTPTTVGNDFQGTLNRVTARFTASQVASLLTTPSTPLTLTIQNNSPSNSTTSLLIDGVALTSANTATAITIKNASFESQSVAVGVYSSGLSSLTNWTIAGGNGKISLLTPTSSGTTNNGVNLRASAVPYVSGSTLLGITNNGTVGKSISQSLTGFLAGEDYVFSGYFGSQYNQSAQFIASDSLVISLSNPGGTVVSNTIAINAIPGVVNISGSDRSTTTTITNSFQGSLFWINSLFPASRLAPLVTGSNTSLTLTILNNSPADSNTSLLVDAVTVASGSTAEPVTPAVSYPGGVVGRWTFDEASHTTVRDYSPNGFHGTLAGNPSWTREGHFNNALIFNGTDSSVALGKSPALSGTTDFTASAWINTAAGSRQVIFQQGATGGSGGYQVAVNANGLVEFTVNGVSGGSFSLTGNAVVNDGRWHLVAVRRSGGTGSIDVDGFQDAQAAGSGGALSSSLPVSIGADAVSGNAYFNGRIDEVRLWNRALGANEILWLRNQSISSISSSTPNVIVIYTDDVGYGDIAYNGGTQISTPNIDQLAATGLNFTDAHAAASTSTPSRYALLTGQYAWRKSGTDILTGNAPLSLDPKQASVPSVFKQAGYTTGLVGKWHLGLGSGTPDWNGIITPGPLEVGFDYSFFFPATADRVPTVYVENQRVVNLDPADPITVSYSGKVGNWPTGAEHPELETVMQSSSGHDGTITNGIGRIGWMTGGTAALWKDEDLSATFTGKAVQFIEDNKDRPFFLYFAIHDIHVPRVPAPQFRGTSGCGTRGDAIHELDWQVGQITAKLKELGLDQNTLIIFSSDNGPVLNDGYADGSGSDQNGHVPAGPYKGGKYSLWEGGTRVPLIVNWPGHVRVGTSNALVGHVDLLATVAGLLNVELPATAAPDSQNQLAAWTGTDDVGRTSLVEQSSGQNVALRQGNWKLINGALYDLSKDIGENSNVASANTDVAATLTASLSTAKSTAVTREVAALYDPSPDVPAASRWIYISLAGVIFGAMTGAVTMRRVARTRKS